MMARDDWKRAGRNDPCPCGSGKKYKHCCMSKDREAARQTGDQSERKASEPAINALAERVPTLTAEDVVTAIEQRNAEERQEEALDALWEEFKSADYAGQLAVCRAAIAAGTLDNELTFGFFNTLFDATVKRGERERFDELVALLRQHQPDLYEAEGPYMLEWQITNALAAGQTGELQTLAPNLARLGPQDVDIFVRILDQLAYHGQVELLAKVVQDALPRIKQASILDWALDEYKGRVIDYIIFDYVERTPLSDLLAPEQTGLLREKLSIIDGIVPEEVVKYVARLGGQQWGSWTLDDFRFGHGRRDDKSASIGRNLPVLAQEFLGYLHREEGISYSKGALASADILRYVQKRHAGELTPASQERHRRRRSRQARRQMKSEVDSPLYPDRATLDSFLAGHFQMLAYEPYRAAALFELTPAWLHFLEARQLIDAHRRGQILSQLDELAFQMKVLWQKYPSDPALLRNHLEQWPES